ARYERREDKESGLAGGGLEAVVGLRIFQRDRGTRHHCTARIAYCALNLSHAGLGAQERRRHAETQAHPANKFQHRNGSLLRLKLAPLCQTRNAAPPLDPWPRGSRNRARTRLSSWMRLYTVSGPPSR